MRRIALLVSCVVWCGLGAGCSTPSTQAEREQLHANVLEAIAAFRQTDPTLSQRFDNAHAYAVFPSVSKGGVGIGGASGPGEVIQSGAVLGFCRVSQVTVGAQLGGQVYRQVIFFQNPEALSSFTGGNFEFAAQASAVAATAGASANADYENGVLVFTQARGGLMYEASIGGQKFSFEPYPAVSR